MVSYAIWYLNSPPFAATFSFSVCNVFLGNSCITTVTSAYYYFAVPSHVTPLDIFLMCCVEFTLSMLELSMLAG